MNDEPENSASGSEAINRFIEFFEKQGWGYTKESKAPVVRTSFSGKNGEWLCVAVAGAEDDHLLFLSLLPCKVPPARRPASAELLTRINYGLNQGCFEMDFEDGEVRFRTTLPLASPDASPELVEHLVFTNLFAVDHFFGAIMQVLYAGVSPKDALATTSSPAPTPRLQLN